LWRVFQDRVSWTICPGWLWTVILLISASWVAGITGVSLQCLARSTPDKSSQKTEENVRSGDKGRWWRGWIQLLFILRIFVNVTMYPRTTIIKIKR
jgi:hypothetical protein